MTVPIIEVTARVSNKKTASLTEVIKFQTGLDFELFFLPISDV